MAEKREREDDQPKAEPVVVPPPSPYDRHRTVRVPGREPDATPALTVALLFSTACAAVFAGVIVFKDFGGKRAADPPFPAAPAQLPAATPAADPEPRAQASPAQQAFDIPAPPRLGGSSPAPALKGLAEAKPAPPARPSTPAMPQAVRPVLKTVSSPYGASAISGVGPGAGLRPGLGARGYIRQAPDGPDELAGPLVGRLLVSLPGLPDGVLAPLAAMIQASARNDRDQARSLARSLCAAGCECRRDGTALVIAAPGGPIVRYDAEPREEGGSQDHFIVTLPSGRAFEFWAAATY